MKQYGPSQEFQDIYFNQYKTVLKFHEDESVKTNSPLDSFLTHKFAYILHNQNLQPNRLCILPYLHERKIFLNRIKQNTKYFYTSLTSVIHDCTGVAGKDNAHKTIAYIFAFNLTESKYYVYSEKGLLLNRVNF